MTRRPLPVKASAGLPAVFTPETTKRRNAQADAVIAYAQRMQDWPLLEQAVDAKLEEQAAFVAWWRATVSVNWGRTSPSKYRDRGTLTFRQAEAMTGIEQQAVSRWAARLEDRDAYRQSLVGAAYRAALLTAAENHRAQGTGDNEWYTPPEYVEAARAVLGEIDLDPASSDVAQRTVKASRYFTREQDGLTQAWPGRVWLNPPYTQPDVGRFVGKLVDELERHQTEAAILLTHNYTDTAWFHLAASVCQAICFTRGRIGFLDSRGNAAAPTQGQAFFYYGLDVEAFRARFTEIGALMRPL